MGFSLPKIVLCFALVALTLVIGRLAMSHSGPSYFIVAGTDFVNPSNTPTPIVTQPGQGYDGQFFYRYSLNPYNFNKDAYGVSVDHPAYRMQRIGYPLIVWFLSFAGMPPLVPYTMLLVNVLAFLGIGFFTARLVQHTGAKPIHALYPLLLCGTYMSLSRNLAEVTELCFFIGSVYYLFCRRYGWFSIFATLTILMRETSFISLLPLVAWLALLWRQNGTKAVHIAFISLPFITFLLWKAVIYSHIPSLSDASAGHTSMGIPFMGIIHGFQQNCNFTDSKHTFESIFWMLYLLWQIVFVVIIFSKISFTDLLVNETGALKLVYLVWLLFAISFTDNIYGDDWGFVRIFSAWNMVGFLLIITGGKSTGKLFNVGSAALVLLTLVRLMIRV